MVIKNEFLDQEAVRNIPDLDPCQNQDLDLDHQKIVMVVFTHVHILDLIAIVVIVTVPNFQNHRININGLIIQDLVQWIGIHLHDRAQDLDRSDPYQFSNL